MKDPKTKLPVLEGPESESDDAGQTCGPAGYVSNEEAALLAAMRQLGQQATDVKVQLDATQDPGERHRLEHRLDELRRRRSELENRREQAYKRKMVMLGHLPASVLDEE